MGLYKPLCLLESCWLVPCCSSDFLGHSFPQHSCVKSVNSGDLAMFSLFSCVLASCLLRICLQPYLHCCPEYQLRPMSHCRSHYCLLPDGLLLGHCPIVALPSAPFIVASRCSIAASSCLWLLMACLSAYPGVLIFLLISLLLSWCLVPGRVAAAFPSRHLFLSVQFLLLALYCHSCLSLVL